jgi:NIPSNAP
LRFIHLALRLQRRSQRAHDLNIYQNEPFKRRIMLYELATFSIKIGSGTKVSEGIGRFLAEKDAHGRLLGCWLSEVGQLNQVFMLREFANHGDLMQERLRAYNALDPFYAGEFIGAMTLDTYERFPFVAPIEPGHYGAFYEIRTYRLKHGGVQGTLDAWKPALPARLKISPIVTAMYALDGEPRMTHIWPYESLDQRQAYRAKAVAEGVWPPKGGSDWLTGDMRSTLTVPLPISPLR